MKHRPQGTTRHKDVGVYEVPTTQYYITRNTMSTSLKIDLDDRPPIIIGKRITVGAAIGSVAAALAHFYPQNAPAIISLAVPVTFFIQILIARYGGVTT